MPIVIVSIILTMVDLGTKYENYKWNVLRRKCHLSRWLASSYKDVRFRAVQGVTFRCNMWMLLIVKLLSFKRYNYPFYKCRENGRQMQCAYSQPVSDKVVPLLFSLRLLIPRNKCKALNQRMLQPLCYRTLIFGCKGTTLSWNKRSFIS